MRRVWQAEQDQEVRTEDGAVPIVSRESLIAAFVDAAVLCHRAGGTVSVVLVRHPTGFPGEMLTAAAVIEWKDRTDARPQPELADPFAQSAPVKAAPAPATEVAIEGLAELGEPDEAVVPVTGVVGDGLDDLDPSLVDESSVPAALQG